MAFPSFQNFSKPPVPADLPPIDFRAELNDEQYEAVTAPKGPCLVLAGAGSGKTRTLTYRVAYLLHKGVAPWNILLLTFTNKAAKEMLDRVEDLTGVSKKQFWGGTFHSIGNRLLRKFGDSVELKSSFNIMDQDDAHGLLSAVIKDLDKDFLKNKSNPKPAVIHSLISYARNTGQDPAILAEERYGLFSPQLPGSIKLFAEAYEKQKKADQVADYDDLLTEWLRLLKEDETARVYCQNQFRYVLVDEYQDTNYLQSAIVDTVAGEHNIMAVGDDAQCIYTWRGADFDNILTFPQRHPETRIIKIETNYRSTPEILKMANAVLANQPAGSGYAKTLVPVREANMTPVIMPFVDTQQQARWVIHRLSALHEEGRSLGDVAILYRSHFHAMELQMELSKAGVPFIITSGVRFFEQAHVRDLTAQLRFIVNPLDYTAFLRFIKLLPKVGDVSARKLHTLIRELAEKNEVSGASILLNNAIIAKAPKDAREEYIQLAQTLTDAYHMMQEGEDPSAITAAIHHGWYADYLIRSYDNADQRQEDLESLAQFARQYENINELLAELVLLSSETGDKSSDDSDEDKVRLTTIHQAKGLEYPVVIVIGCADSLFPTRRSIEEDNMDEERRLFYVALTRAMDELYLTYPLLSLGRGPATRLAPSRFIEELPSYTFEFIRQRPTRSPW